MSDIKKFTSGTKVDLVNKKDLIQTGDWILKWSPNSPVNETGFSLFTPGNFDPSNKSSPRWCRTGCYILSIGKRRSVFWARIDS